MNTATALRTVCGVCYRAGHRCPPARAAGVIRAALAAGELTWGELLALPAGGAS